MRWYRCLYRGRPMWVNSELNASDAFVAAWLPGTEGQGIADVLLADASGQVQHDFKGKLSFSWPKLPLQTAVNKGDADYAPLLPYGFGLTYKDESTLANNLNEDSGVDISNLAPLSIFNGSFKTPWRLFLNSNNEQHQVASNSVKLGGITYRTEDKVIQEDAMQFSFDGTAISYIEINSNFTEDKVAYIEANSALSFSYKVNKIPSSPVYLAMKCEQGCGGELDLTNELKKTDLNTWQTMSIDLTCFAEKGIDFARVTSPFIIKTAGEFSVSVADISFEPQGANTAKVSCE